jgi:hypothetical protein
MSSGSDVFAANEKAASNLLTACCFLPIPFRSPYACAPPGTGGMIGFKTDGLVSPLGLSERALGVGSSSSSGKPAINLRI